MQVLLQYYQNLTSRTQQFETDIIDLYEQLSDSTEAKQTAFQAARDSLPDLEAEIQTHGEEDFLEISSLSLESQVSNMIFDVLH